MYYSTVNQLVTLSITGSTAGFAVGDDLEISSLATKTNIRIAGFTGNLGRTLLVKLTSAAVNEKAITPNYPFIQGNFIVKVSNPSLTAAIHSDNWISTTVGGSGPFNTTWYGEPNYNPSRHELFTYSNGTHGVPNGYNSSFYEGTMFGLTGTDMSCVLMSDRPDVPFGWWNERGSKIACLMTRQHILNITHYPANANEMKCVAYDGTVHSIKKLSVSQFVAGITGMTAPPANGSWPTGLSACGNGVMYPSLYPQWYKRNTGREIYQDYDLDPNGTSGFAMTFGECYIQTFKTPLPEKIKPALMPTINCENQFSITNLVLANQDLSSTLLSSVSTRTPTTRSNIIDALYQIFPTHLNGFPEGITSNSNPFYPITTAYNPSAFYSHLNEMPMLVINNTFARGFVRRSRLAGISVILRSYPTSIPLAGSLNEYQYLFLSSVSGLNATYAKNSPWNDYSSFESDQGSYMGEGDSGSIMFAKRNNRLVYHGGVQGAFNNFALTNSPTGTYQVDGGAYCMGTSYSGGTCNQFDSSSYNLLTSPFIGVSHDHKKMLDIMLTDKSWQITTDTTNAAVSNDYKIFESDLQGHSIEWYDYMDELLPLYLEELAEQTEAANRMYGNTVAREDSLPKVVSSLPSDSISIRNKPYEIELPDQVGALGSQPTNNNLAMPTNFKFSIKRVPDLSYFCTSVSLPGWSNPIISIPTGVPGGRKNLRVNSNSISHGEASFKFLVNEDMSNYDALMKWFKECIGFNDYSQVTYRNWMSEEGHLLVLSNKKKPLFKLTFRGLFPTNVSELSFKANDTEATPMTATVTMAFTYFDVERLNNQ